MPDNALYDANADLSHKGEKVGFFDAPPVEQAGAYTQTYSTAARVVTETPAAITGAPAEADHNALRDQVEALTKVVNALVDDLQAYGLAQ
jgi:hypothetical protein